MVPTEACSKCLREQWRPAPNFSKNHSISFPLLTKKSHYSTPVDSYQQSEQSIRKLNLGSSRNFNRVPTFVGLLPHLGTGGLERLPSTLTTVLMGFINSQITPTEQDHQTYHMAKQNTPGTILLIRFQSRHSLTNKLEGVGDHRMLASNYS